MLPKEDAQASRQRAVAFEGTGIATGIGRSQVLIEKVEQRLRSSKSASQLPIRDHGGCQWSHWRSAGESDSDLSQYRFAGQSHPGLPGELAEPSRQAVPFLGGQRGILVGRPQVECGHGAIVLVNGWLGVVRALRLRRVDETGDDQDDNGGDENVDSELERLGLAAPREKLVEFVLIAGFSGGLQGQLV